MSNARRPLAAAAVLVSLVLTSCSVSTEPTGSKTTTTAEPPAPGAPARGVTDDSIKIGAAFIDADEVKAKFGVDLGTMPPEIFPALAQWTNDNGGINGRDVEIVERLVLPVGTESSDQACRELVEDEEVFVIMGTFLGDTALCATETYDTPYFGGFGLTPERQERSKAPFITTAANEGDATTAAVELLIEEGELEGRKVAVYSESSATSQTFVEQNVLDVLEAGDVEVVSNAALAVHGGDAVAAGNELDTVLQRFEADGADTLLAISGLSVLVPALERSDWDARVIFTNGQIIGGDALEGFGLTDPARLEGAIGATEGLTPEESSKDPAILECIDGINSVTDLAITSTDLLSKDEDPKSRDFRHLPLICAIWNLTVASLEAAGDDPTAESIVAGLDDVDAAQVTGNPTASLSAERWGAGGQVRMWEYDEATTSFHPVDG